jgi:hypothetical protein
MIIPRGVGTAWGSLQDPIDLGIGGAVLDSLHAPQYHPGTCATA